MRLVADQSLYETCIDCGFDLSVLEQIERVYGRLIVQGSIADRLYDKLEHSALESLEIVAWKTKIALDNQEYYDFLANYTTDAADPFEIIEEEAKKLRAMIQKIDSGISEDDAVVLATAKWMREFTEYDPLVISDDADIITSGQIIASFFGLGVIFVSSIELFRQSLLDLQFKKSCTHFSVNIRDNIGFDQPWTRQDLIETLASAVKKGRLACHSSTKFMKIFE